MNTLEHIAANSKVMDSIHKKDEKYWANYYRIKLKNILAVTHRDGGEYTETHGIEKSTQDAIQIIAGAIVR